MSPEAMTKLFNMALGGGGVVLILFFLKWALFLVIHMTPDGCGCLLNFLFGSSFRKPKQTAHRRGYGNNHFFFFLLLAFPVKSFLCRGAEQGGQAATDKVSVGHRSFSAPKNVPSPSREILASSRGIASWSSSPSSSLAMPAE